jgi:hypothetical protein
MAITFTPAHRALAVGGLAAAVHHVAVTRVRLSRLLPAFRSRL